MDRDIKLRPFLEWAKAAQKRINNAYEEPSTILNQGTVIGNVREAVISGILRSFLPSSVDIGTGQIVDSLGNTSDQMDIVIAKNTVPVFRFEGGTSAFLFETVLATIEVKSVMYKEKIEEALNNTKSLSDLRPGLHSISKGHDVISEALAWVESIGGIDELETRLNKVDIHATLNCPEHIWEVSPFIRFWLHWKKGNFRYLQTFEQLNDIINEPDFDLFISLLASTLKRNVEDFVGISLDYHKADEIEADFFNVLYKYIFYENFPPAKIILAYRGYQRIDQLVHAARSWFKRNRNDVDWYSLPALIMTDKLVMYRRYNEFHCHEFDYPVLHLMNVICNALARNMHFPVSIGGEATISQYFSLARIYPGVEHPKYSRSYKVWTIPLDNSSEGILHKPSHYD